MRPARPLRSSSRPRSWSTAPDPFPHPAQSTAAAAAPTRRSVARLTTRPVCPVSRRPAAAWRPQQTKSGGERGTAKRVLRPDGLGAQSRDAAALVPADGDRQRGVPARSVDRRAPLGQRGRPLLHPGVGHDPLDPPRRPRCVGAASVLAELRPDDVLLLRGRPRGAPRVRHGRAPGAAASRAARGRRALRDARAGPDLRGGECRRLARSRLRRCDVDRHRLRARDAGARRAEVPRPAARFHADRRRGRRHRRADRDRDGVHERLQGGPARWPPRRCSSSSRSRRRRASATGSSTWRSAARPGSPR